MIDHSEWETYTKVVRNKVGTDLRVYILKVSSEEEEEKALLMVGG